MSRPPPRRPDRPDRPGPPDSAGLPDADLTAAIAEASRSLGVRYEPAGVSAAGRDPGGAWRRPLWVVVGLLVLGIGATLALRGSGFRSQPAHLVETDLRWAVARVVEHVERERVLRGRLPEARELRLLLGDALTYSVPDGEGGGAGRVGAGPGYRVVGQREGVRVEYDGSVPLDDWRARVLHPPGSGGR